MTTQIESDSSDKIFYFFDLAVGSIFLDKDKDLLMKIPSCYRDFNGTMVEFNSVVMGGEFMGTLIYYKPSDQVY